MLADISLYEFPGLKKEAKCAVISHSKTCGNCKFSADAQYFFNNLQNNFGDCFFFCKDICKKKNKKMRLFANFGVQSKRFFICIFLGLSRDVK